MKGIFDSPTETVDMGVGIDAAAPRLTIATEIADTLCEEDLLRIRGKEYSCRNFDPDGAGLTIIDLK